jgi:hypothetical protein
MMFRLNAAQREFLLSGLALLVLLFVTTPLLVKFYITSELVLTEIDITAVGLVFVAVSALALVPALALPTKVLLGLAAGMRIATVWIAVVAFLLPVQSGRQTGAVSAAKTLAIAGEFALYLALLGLIVAIFVFRRRIGEAAAFAATVIAILAPAAFIAVGLAGTERSSTVPAFPVAMPSLQANSMFFRMHAEAETASSLTLGRKSNIIVVLLDEQKGGLSEQVLREDDDLRAAFSGFTFFSDTLSTATRTDFSLPTVHTGEPYLGQKYDNWYETAENTGFISDALAAGFRTFYLAYIRQTACPPSICVHASAFRAEPWWMLVGQEYIKTILVSGMRITPQMLHPLLTFASEWTGDTLFNAMPSWRESFYAFDTLIDNLRVTESESAFLLAHLAFTHRPIAYDGDCVYYRYPSQLSQLRYADQVGQVRCGIRQLAKLVRKVKQLGIFEMTAFLFLSDHGDNILNPVEFYPSPREMSYIPGEEDAFHALLMIKPFNATGTLRFSDAPASLLDVRNTLCAWLPLCRPRGSGANLVTLDPHERRVRELIQYRHSGDLYDEQMRLRTDKFRRIRLTGPIGELSDAFFNPPVWPQSKLDFGLGGNAVQYTFRGWALPESGGRWTDGRNGAAAILRLPLAKPIIGAKELTITAAAYGEDQVVSLNANGIRVATVTILAGGKEGVREYHFCLPARIVAGKSVLELTIEPSKPISPAEREGLIYDERRLGVFVSEIQVESRDPQSDCVQ